MRTLAILLFCHVVVHAQSERLSFIKGQVQAINQDRTVVVDTLDLLETAAQPPDGGGEITYHYRQGRLVKIRSELFPSYGRYMTEYYFHNDTLMLVTERVDHLFLSDSSGQDRTRLVNLFTAAYYLWTVDEEVGAERIGTRVLSEGVCGQKEWEPEVERLRSLAPRRGRP